MTEDRGHPVHPCGMDPLLAKQLGLSVRPNAGMDLELKQALTLLIAALERVADRLHAAGEFNSGNAATLQRLQWIQFAKDKENEK